MNQRIEDAKKKLRSACVDFVREEAKIVGDHNMAAALFCIAFNEIVQSLTLEDFTESPQKGGAK